MILAVIGLTLITVGLAYINKKLAKSVNNSHVLVKVGLIKLLGLFWFPVLVFWVLLISSLLGKPLMP